MSIVFNFCFNFCLAASPFGQLLEDAKTQCSTSVVLNTSIAIDRLIASVVWVDHNDLVVLKVARKSKNVWAPLLYSTTVNKSQGAFTPTAFGAH